MPKAADFDPKKAVMRAVARVRSGGWIGSATNSLEKEEDTEAPQIYDTTSRDAQNSG